MPELPEVETLRRDLEREIGGKRVKTVEVTGAGAVQHLTKKQFAERLEGAKIASVGRRDLRLVAKLDTGDLLVFTVEGGGHLRRQAPKDERAKGTKLVVTFTQGGQLRAIDDDNHLQVNLVAAEDLLTEFPDLAELGPDPVDEPMSWTAFANLVVRRKGTKLRALLVDRTFIAGIGPVYADEILHAAGLRLDRDAGTLSTQELRRLYRAVVETLHEAAKHRGVTMGADGFTDLAGKPGGWMEELQVYERDGQACNRCRGVVSKIRFAGKPAYECLACQV